jgi:uncharacterized membrane protein YdjX (TVP38/TMEM64 family)
LQQNAVWRRAVILILLCVVLAWAASSSEVHGALIALLEVAESTILRNPVLGAVLFVLFAAFSAMLAFVSIAIVVPVAVYVWGAPLTMVLMWLGWILGGVFAYIIGRSVGRVAVNWLTMGAALSRLERHVNTHTPFGMILLFQLALPSELPGYLLGLTRYSFPKCLLAFAIAEIPYSVATVLLGANFVERRGGMVLMIGLALVAASLGLFYLLSVPDMPSRYPE